MAEFLAVGDLHLVDNLGKGGLSKYIKNASEFVISEVTKVLAYGKKHGIYNVILLGDIFESPRGSYEGMVALTNFFKLNPKFTFYAILGNHDKLSKNYTNDSHSLEVIQTMNIPNFKLYTEPTLEIIEGSSIYFMPWPCKSFKANCLNVAHVEVNGATSDSGRKFENTKDTDPEHLLSNTNHVGIIGHLHSAHQVRNLKYCGTIYQTNFGESVDKYFAHIRFNTVEDYEIELIPNVPEYRLLTVIVNSKSDLDLISKNPKDLTKLIIHEGSDINLADYSELSNVVMVKAFKNKQELQAILTEDLISGQELVIKTSDFFASYLKNLDISDDLKLRCSKLRVNLLLNL